ncbi:putative Exo-glucosaminidase lytG precursor [Blattamonas nauphoetae]|uniref:Exo-glucosaminidase lytG n=1 Tax=Blattamonas nauphoetae TaxID=2049346 RepID=A0ABQ9X5L8_9EUKA|nr:putative Exo-glucosaminidase lytG precursor [Blattamonas nauphoetae]
MAMLAATLVATATKICTSYKTVYMIGVFGSPVTTSIINQKRAQYPTWYTPDRVAFYNTLVGKGYFGFDCVCFIKGILWGWNGDASKTHGGAVYASNNVPDIGEDLMITRCHGVSNTFRNIAPGEALWLQGHIGVYLGSGKGAECTPAWQNKCQITAVANIGPISGLNSRRWAKHGKLPYVTY